MALSSRSSDVAHTKEQKRQWRAKMRALAMEYLGGRCAVCGTDENLEFHHKNPSEKDHDVIHYFDLDEIEKCELRCVSCHDKFHAAKHGTHRRYYMHGCRCKICEAGRIARQKARPSRAKAKKDLLINRPPKHGTKSGYTHGCRCVKCKKANAEYARAYRKRKAK
jgi:hypothetical protein